MAQKIHDRSSSKKHRSGTTGPRTVAGKSRSSQNAAKHHIFSRGILENEKKEASKLYAQIQHDMRPRSALALELIGDLVLNRLQKHRIDAHAAHEFRKASLVAVLDESDKINERLRQLSPGPATAPDGANSGVRSVLVSNFRIIYLETLKRVVEERGPSPDEDLSFLDRIYAGRITMEASQIVMLYKLQKLSENPGDADVSKIPSDKAEYQTLIVAAIDNEILMTKMRMEFETSLDALNNPGKRPILLDDPVADKIERYDAANARTLTHILDALQRIRRLGK